MSSIDLWPFFSSRTLERRSIPYTQQRNHHHHQKVFSPKYSFSTQPSFYQYFITIFMGERRRNHKLCFFCDERFLYAVKGDPHQQRLILCYQLHAHHYHYLFVHCLQTNNTILFFFLFFVYMNKINRKKIEWALTVLNALQR